MKRYFAAFLAFVLVMSFMPAALADDSNDETPPHLLSVTLNASTYTGADTLTVTVTTDESGDGFNLDDIDCRCSVGFLDYDPNNPSMALDGVGVMLDTVSAPGVLQGSVALNRYTGGTYRLCSVALCDKNGNSSTYYANYQDIPTATGPVPDVSFTLDSDYHQPDPTKDPADTALKKFTLSKSKANVGDTITYTITANDSSIVKMTMMIVPMCVPWYFTGYNLPLSPVSGKPGVFTGKFKVTADMPQGDYYPSELILTPRSGPSIDVSWPSNYNYYLGNVVLKVTNPKLALTGEDLPVITSLTISTHNLVQGQTATITATLNAKYPSFDTLSFGLLNTDNGRFASSSIEVNLKRQSDYKYSGTIQIPLGLRHGHYILCMPAMHLTTGDAGGVNINSPIKTVLTNSSQDKVDCIKGGELVVSSAVSISGAANKTLLVGSAFDPMEGISASNAYTGDITDKITLTGSVDANTPGVYLLKYEATDNIPVNGTDTPFTFTAYRWVAITEILPDPSAGSSPAPAVLTDGNLAIGAESGDATLKKDGRSVAFSKVVTAPGVYTVTSGTTSSEGATATLQELTAQPGSGNTVTAVIDRSAPAVQAAWHKAATGMLVALKASDIAGVVQIKYKAGSCSLSDCKSNGAAYTKAFTIPGYGKVTVYTRDKLGNEGVTVINVNTASTDSAYLAGISLSSGKLSGAFSRSVYSYSVKLGETVSAVTVTPKALWDGSVITINGRTAASARISVANGKSVKATIKVTFGSHSRTYKLTISRAKSTNCNLGTLTASAGRFTAAFNPAVTNYTLKLDEYTKSVTLRDATASSLAKASFGSKKLYLNPGQRVVVKITVKAQSGAKKTYTVTVVRAKSSDTRLASMKTNASSLVLTPAFTPGVMSYSLKLPAATASVKLTVKPSGYLAVTRINGTAAASKTVTVQRGKSVVVRVIVTAQAGNTKEYDITVSRQ